MGKRKNRSSKAATSSARSPSSVRSRSADKPSVKEELTESKEEAAAPRFAPSPPKKRPVVLISMIVAWVAFLVFLVIAATVG